MGGSAEQKLIQIQILVPCSGSGSGLVQVVIAAIVENEFELRKFFHLPYHD